VAARFNSSALILLGGMLFVTARLDAQVPVVGGPLPQEVEAEALDLLNDPAVLRFSGGSRIPAGSRVEGDVAVLAGSLELGGEITGRLLVANGDLVLRPASRVGGGVVVIGGVVSGEANAALDGGVAVYSGPLRYRISGGRVQPVSTEDTSSGGLTSDLGFGQARLSIRAAGAYNRVEGLPVYFGGTIRTAGANPLTLEARGIWRSVSGLNLTRDELGHSFGLTQAVGGRGTAAIGVSVRDEIVPIEDQGFSDLESSLATFFFRQDLRDYSRRHGWSAFANFRPGRPPLEAVLTFREEDHETAPLRSPWTLRDQNDPWRPLPLVAEGTSRSIEGELRWDSRDDPLFPADGWLLDARFERQIGGSLTLPDSGPAMGEPTDASFESADVLPRFSRGSLDIRRYARVGPTTRLSLRAFLAGSLTGSPLPPQYQTALGGEGSLPGYRRFTLDCGARSTARFARTGDQDAQGRTIDTVFPAYGCDRAVLFQAELQNALPRLGNPLPDSWEDSELASLLDIQPVWSIFLDAGRGWALGDLGNAIPRPDSPTRLDVGVGLFLGPVGVYWSYPLNRQELDLNFFVRLAERF
jgi:hypothetical protein